LRSICTDLAGQYGIARFDQFDHLLRRSRTQLSP
jgi:hypothetical protein